MSDYNDAISTILNAFRMGLAYRQMREGRVQKTLDDLRQVAESRARAAKELVENVMEGNLPYEYKIDIEKIMNNPELWDYIVRNVPNAPEQMQNQLGEVGQLSRKFIQPVAPIPEFYQPILGTEPIVLAKTPEEKALEEAKRKALATKYAEESKLPFWMIKERERQENRLERLGKQHENRLKQMETAYNYDVNMAKLKFNQNVKMEEMKQDFRREMEDTKFEHSKKLLALRYKYMKELAQYKKGLSGEDPVKEQETKMRMAEMAAYGILPKNKAYNEDVIKYIDLVGEGFVPIPSETIDDIRQYAPLYLALEYMNSIIEKYKKTRKGGTVVNTFEGAIEWAKSKMSSDERMMYRLLSGFAVPIAKRLMGEVGNLSEQEQKRAAAFLVDPWMNYKQSEKVFNQLRRLVKSVIDSRLTGVPEKQKKIVLVKHLDPRLHKMLYGKDPTIEDVTNNLELFTNLPENFVILGKVPDAQ